MAKDHHRDRVIESLAEDLVAREAELIDARRDRESYRLLTKLAIHQLAQLTTENQRLRSRVRELAQADRDATAEDVAA